MGACEISRTVVAEKGKISFRDLMEYQTDDPYSGSWNTIHSISKTIKVFDKATDKNVKNFFSMKKYQKLVDSTDCPKWSAVVFDLGVTGYEVRSVKKVKSSGSKPKYAILYDVLDEDGKHVTAKNFKSMKEAETFAADYALRNNRFVYTKKHSVLVSGKEPTTSFQIQRTMKKTMPKTVKAGTKVVELHKYYIVGLAAC